MSDHSKSSPPLTKRRIGSRDFLVTFGTNIAIQFCTILQGILLARTLGPKGRGEFAAATLWPMFFAGICSFGTIVAVARRSAKLECSASLAWAAVRLSFLTAGVGMAICWVLLPFLIPAGESDVLRAARCFVPFILFNHIALILMAVDQGAGRFGNYNWTRLIVNPVFLLCVVGLWAASVSRSIWYVIGLLFANAVVAIARFTMVFKLRGKSQERVSLRGVLRESLPFGLAGMLSPVFQQADKALLLFLLGTEQLGIYTVALTASTAIGTLSAAATPIVFGISAQDEPAVSVHRISRVFRMSAWVWVIAGSALAAVIPWLLPRLYTQKFHGAVLPAMALIPAGALAGQASILEESLRAKGLAFVGIPARIASLITLVALGIFLAPRWGILGVVAAYNVAQVVVLLVMMWQFYRNFPRHSEAHLSPQISDLVEMGKRCRHFFKSAVGSA